MFKFLSVALGDTAVETVHLVNPSDTNPLGILHGGNMMDWLVSAAMLAVSRLSRGNAVLGSLDSVFFINPVRVGDVVFIKAWVEYTGNSSLEVAVKAEAENPISQTSSVTTFSHMAFVTVGFRGEPRTVPIKVRPKKNEVAAFRSTEKRYLERKKALADRKQKSVDLEVYAPRSKWKLNFSKIVLQDDVVYGDLMFGGRLLKLLDELTGTLATRYCKGAVVTGSVDDMNFYYPMRVGDILDVTVAINHVGRASLEIGAKVFNEDPFTGNRHHAATAYYTFVHVDSNGKAAPVPPYTPRTKDERKRWSEAEQRSEERKRRISALKELLEKPGASIF